MNLLLQKAPITAEEFLALRDSKGYELVDGELVELNRGAESSSISGELARLLRNHCADNPLGWVFPPETTYQFFTDRPNLVRKPDVSFVRLGRLEEERLPRGHIRIAPDLAAEVVSPNDLFEEVENKVAEYRRDGVRLIWVVNPSTRTVLVRRLDGTAAEVGPGGELDGEDVVPGFRCRVADLFRPPAGVPGTA
jgi:Uma2 family endonuclease